MSFEPGGNYQGGYPPNRPPPPPQQRQQQQQPPPQFQRPRPQQQQEYDYQQYDEGRGVGGGTGWGGPGGGAGGGTGSGGEQGRGWAQDPYARNYDMQQQQQHQPQQQGRGGQPGYEEDLGNRFAQQMSFPPDNRPMPPQQQQQQPYGGPGNPNLRQFHRPFNGAPQQQQFGGRGGPPPPHGGGEPGFQRSMTMPIRAEEGFRSPPRRPPFQQNGGPPPMSQGPPQRYNDDGTGYRESILGYYANSGQGYQDNQYGAGDMNLNRSRSQPSLRDGPLDSGPHPPVPQMPQDARGGSFEGRRPPGGAYGWGPQNGPLQGPPEGWQGSGMRQPPANRSYQQGPPDQSRPQYGGNRAPPFLQRTGNGMQQPNNGYGGQGYYPEQAQRPSFDQTQRPSFDQAQRPSSNPDGLPEHPPPTRPGLMSGGGQQGHPPPQRQYSTSTQGATPGNRSSGPITHGELDILRGEARNHPNDPALQLRFAKKLIEASAVLADDGDPKSTKKNRESFIFEAHKTIKKITTGAHPDPEAMFFLANCYGDGSLGLEVDHEKAFSLYQSAAKLNHPGSAYRTAVCCEIGAGTRKEAPKAMQWYRKAASMGDTAAMYKLGMILYRGLLGQPKSVREALSWLKRAADNADADNPHALHQLGIIYETEENSDYIIRDIDYARDLFMQAAELGYTPSQFKLGNAYAYGLLGCPVDARLSITWYSRAAAKGDPESELALSGWYLTGAEGILEQNDTEAYLWARKAAEKGLAKAEYGVGHFTELGIGLGGVGNEEEAKKWYFRAAGQGHHKSQERLRELSRGGSKKQREKLNRKDKAKDDADCVLM